MKQSSNSGITCFKSYKRIQAVCNNSINSDWLSGVISIYALEWVLKCSLISHWWLQCTISKLCLHTAELVALISWCSVCVTTQTVQMPALSHMEPCLLLAAIALYINTASIKTIKIHKVHQIKSLLPALAKKCLLIFWNMPSIWIQGWKSGGSELLVLLMNKCSSPKTGKGKVSWQGCIWGPLVRFWTLISCC